MVAGLLDTSIIVDVLRLHHPAEKWLAQQQQLGVSTSVWLEVLQGANSRQKQNQATTILKRFDRVEHLSDYFEWAIQQMIGFHLSYNIGLVDCLIASTSYRLQIPLYTMNMKHFAPLLGGLAQKPY